MNKWLLIPDSTKSKTYVQIAVETGMASFSVEKDWWVVQTLAIIFEMKVSEKLDFELIISELLVLKSKINAVDWQIEIK